MRIRPKSALDSVPAAQSLRLGLRRPTSLYTREARGKGSKSAQNVKILLSLRGAPATWQSVFSLYRCGIYVRRQEDADCHDRCAHRSRDGGIPRFINLPPSPFRGNDRGIRTGKPICHAVQGAMVSGRHRGRPVNVASCTNIKIGALDQNNLSLPLKGLGGKLMSRGVPPSRAQFANLSEHPNL